ncbi:hypothetical protein D9619_007546 [Psilocybe cf. subviscida]|uniref:Uncharacterized protein n=1 Tax=Psilocybe cf. subviscida TaxID=2480587 RepID=A0A8H5B2A2_9AGAR|nr:hypothetical protein D9619_007546 [Psilocybe cf. subviscida]
MLRPSPTAVLTHPTPAVLHYLPAATPRWELNIPQAATAAAAASSSAAAAAAAVGPAAVSSGSSTRRTQSQRQQQQIIGGNTSTRGNNTISVHTKRTRMLAAALERYNLAKGPMAAPTPPVVTFSHTPPCLNYPSGFTMPLCAHGMQVLNLTVSPSDFRDIPRLRNIPRPYHSPRPPTPLSLRP